MSAEGILAFVRCLQCYGIMCTIALSQVCIASYLSKSLQAAATHTHTDTLMLFQRVFCDSDDQERQQATCFV